MRSIEGVPPAPRLRMAIVMSKYRLHHQPVNQARWPRLCGWRRDDAVAIIKVPGAFELPLPRAMPRVVTFGAVICLGCLTADPV
jgi:6,7-dimethyl-8-ribityllumazine synthase